MNKKCPIDGVTWLCLLTTWILNILTVAGYGRIFGIPALILCIISLIRGIKIAKCIGIFGVKVMTKELEKRGK